MQRSFGAALFTYTTGDAGYTLTGMVYIFTRITMDITGLPGKEKGHPIKSGPDYPMC